MKKEETEPNQKFRSIAAAENSAPEGTVTAPALHATLIKTVTFLWDTFFYFFNHLFNNK